MKIRHISLLGHKDHGKSTLIGSLLMQTGAATQVRIKEATEYSKKLHKEFEPAFILDSFAEEREQGMTYDTTRAQVKFKDIAFELIDVPGHEELIKNMISGASYGELAVLLVSAKPDEGIRDQTKRHLFLSKMLGIKYVVVAVNKMDTIAYDKNKFDEIKQDLQTFLRKIGYKEDEMEFVPISAYHADNLVKKSPNMKWYKGESLMDAVYGMLENEKQTEKPELRLIVQGTIGDGKDEMITGKVSSGELKLGDKVKIIPGDGTYTVKQLFVKGAKGKAAKVGENVAIKLDGQAKGSLRGSVICGANDQLSEADDFKATIFVTGRLGKGTTVRFNGIETGAQIKVSNGIDVVTGNEISKKEITPLSAGNIEIKLDTPIAAEPFEVSRDLGRFVIYKDNTFSGIGIIKEAIA